MSHKQSLVSRILVSLLVILLLAVLFPAQLLASDRPPSRNRYSKSTLGDTAPDHVKGEVLVKLREGVSEEKVRATFARHGISASNYELIAEPLTWYLVNFNEEQTDIKDVIRDFLSDDEILGAEANCYRSESFVPYDPLSYEQWAIWPRDDQFGATGSIELTKAWDWPSGANGVTVAVIDSGINSAHEDLRNRVVGGYNFRGDPGDTTDVTGHGTMVSGIIAAETDNNLGIAGAAGTCPNVSIMPLRIADSEGHSTSVLSTRAIMYAAQHGAKIINMSYGGTDLAEAEQDAINTAYQNGCILVASSGNLDLPDHPIYIVQYPAAYDNVIAVGATDGDGRRWIDSCYGENLDMMAPGVDILSTGIDGDYWYGSGTSFAAPFVSGVAALILASRSDLSPAIVTECLTSTAYSLPGYTAGEYGAGLLDAYGAVNKALPPDIQVETSKWYFPEGCTNGFEEWLCIQNAGDDLALVGIDYMFPSGPPLYFSFYMDPRTRTTIAVHEQFPGIDVSAKVYSNRDKIYAERSMYWSGSGVKEGHNCHGLKEPATTWYLAEGCDGTQSGFDTWVLVQNPNDEPTDVIATFQTDEGKKDGPTFTMSPHSRSTIHVNDHVDDDTGVSTMVTSDKPVLAERAMYWNIPPGGGPTDAKGGHASLGVPTASTQWFLAEGSTDGFDTYVLIQNPNEMESTVDVTYMTSSGVVEQDLEVPGNSRETIHLNDYVDGRPGVSTKVEASPAVIAERSMYWDSLGEIKGPGHSSEGAPLAAKTWYLAEGSTSWGFETWVLVQNPNKDIADIEVTYMTPEGQDQGNPIELKPLARHTINVADFVGNDVSTLITSSIPVVAERAMYWNGRAGGASSVGMAEDEYRNTKTGTGWVIMPEGETTFSEVTSAGTTVIVDSFEHRSDGPPLGYLPVCEGTYYHLATTAEYRGNIDIDLNYFGLPDGVPTEYIRLLFYNEDTGTWSDITTGVDPERKVVKGTTGSTGILCVAVPVTVEVHPETLNLNSQGRWITTYIGLPEGYDAGGIDVETVRLRHGEHVIDADWGNVEEDGRLMVKFDRQAVSAILPVADEVELFISGEFHGVLFRASDHIRVISPGK